MDNNDIKKIILTLRGNGIKGLNMKIQAAELDAKVKVRQVMALAGELGLHVRENGVESNNMARFVREAIGFELRPSYKTEFSEITARVSNWHDVLYAIRVEIWNYYYLLNAKVGKSSIKTGERLTGFDDLLLHKYDNGHCEYKMDDVLLERIQLVLDIDEYFTKILA